MYKVELIMRVTIPDGQTTETGFLQSAGTLEELQELFLDAVFRRACPIAEQLMDTAETLKPKPAEKPEPAKEEKHGKETQDPQGPTGDKKGTVAANGDSRPVEPSVVRGSASVLEQPNPPAAGASPEAPPPAP